MRILAAAWLILFFSHDVPNSAHATPLAGLMARPLSTIRRESTVDKDQTSSDKNKESADEWKILEHKSIFTALVDAGVMMHPKSAKLKKAMQAIKELTDADEARIHVVGKKLILTNCTFGLDSNEPLVRVKKMCISWNSYKEPVLSINVDDVDVCVQFMNHYLTKTNWVRQASGFPTSFTFKVGNTTEELRIDSIKVTGKIKLRVSSRPLNRELGVLALDTSALRGLSEEIQRQATESVETTGKRGLTVDELTILLQQYFMRKTHLHVLSEFHGMITNNPKEAAHLRIHMAMEKAIDAVTTKWEESGLGPKVKASVAQAVDLTAKHSRKTLQVVAKSSAEQADKLRAESSRRLQSLAKTSMEVTSDVTQKSKHFVAKEFKAVSSDLNARVAKILQENGMLKKPKRGWGLNR